MTNSFRISSDKKAPCVVDGKVRKFRHVYGTASSETVRVEVTPFMPDRGGDTHSVEAVLFGCRTNGRAMVGHFMCSDADSAIHLAEYLAGKL
jgi:hypothetical protein